MATKLLAYLELEIEIKKHARSACSISHCMALIESFSDPEVFWINHYLFPVFALCSFSVRCLREFKRTPTPIEEVPKSRCRQSSPSYHIRFQLSRDDPKMLEATPGRRKFSSYLFDEAWHATQSFPLRDNHFAAVSSMGQSS